MSLLVRFSAGVAAVGVALTLGTATASAKRLTLDDAARDTWRHVSGASGPVYARSDVQVNSDVLSMTFRHARRAVLVSTRFADLRKQGASVNLAVELRTDKGVQRTLVFNATAGRDWRGSLAVIDDTGRRVDCTGKQRHIDWRTDVVTMSIPRTCAGRPQWVRFNASDAWVTRHNEIYADNPHDRRPSSTTFTRRVFRG